MGLGVCHKGTGCVPLRAALLALAGWGVVLGQTAPDWRKIGTEGVDLMLSSPATGPVERVWYSADGSLLYARTLAGKVFQTGDFENWKPAANAPAPPPVWRAATVRLPEPGAQVIAVSSNATRIWGMGRQLSRSDDGGRSWTNLTAYGAQSVIGPGQRSIAVSPADPDQISIANDYGVWRSMDGGMSWAGLNQSLPNLAVRRIVSTPTGSAGARVMVENLGVLELPHGGTVWRPAPNVLVDEEARKRDYSAIVQAEVTAFGRSGDVVFAGSGDGRIWMSLNGGATFQPTNAPRSSTGRVERIFVNAQGSRVVALAALSGGGARVLRTTNGGEFWDVLDSNLPAGSAYSVTADRAAGAVYVATDKGVFYGHADLEGASTNPVNWQNLTEQLPAARATDVALDPAAVQLYIALDGYGLYAAAAPHRRASPQIVNAADFSTRPAAPGSLLSVVGVGVNAAAGGGLNYPVLANPLGESQIQVPFDAVGPNVALALDTPAGQLRRDLAVLPVSPAILLLDQEGTPALYDADSGLSLDGKNSAHSNGRVQIMATGLGRVRPDWPTGMQAPMQNPPAVVASVKAFLDGNPIQVTSATLAPGHVGFYIVEVQLPAITNLGTSELYISADGQDSNRVQLVIEP
jgi:uncharacterized protein (TIGR03437 family)